MAQNMTPEEIAALAAAVTTAQAQAQAEQQRIAETTKVPGRVTLTRLVYTLAIRPVLVLMAAFTDLGFLLVFQLLARLVQHKGLEGINPLPLTRKVPRTGIRKTTTLAKQQAKKNDHWWNHIVFFWSF